MNRYMASSSSILCVLLPLFLLQVCFCFCAAADENYTTFKPVSSLRLARIYKHLSKINKSPVLTILSPDGDIIDCVHKRKQPAFDHPLLKHHKIQRVAPQLPKFNVTRLGKTSESEDAIRSEAVQTWRTGGRRCPSGTVPIRRSTMQDVLRANSLYDFGKKQRSSLNRHSRQADAPDVVSGNGHEHAIAYTGTSKEIYGARAMINVWNPSVESANEFSLSQIWVLSGSFNDDLNSIEAGWQVSPELYGDNKPRLFTYWTSDAYQATGCYNLLCSGFIQTNNEIAVGASISPVSSFDGSQFDISVIIWKDPLSGHWWLGFGEDNTLVGYWPKELFTHLRDHATMVEFGGEVVNTRASGIHTSTKMGSGHFAESGFAHASYFKNLELVDSDNSLTSTGDLSLLSENSNCYNIQGHHNDAWGAHFYYGGPGANLNCQ